MRCKKTSIRTMMMVLSGLILTVSLMAQRGYGPGGNNQERAGIGRYCQAIPDLTDEQEQQIMNLRTAHMKEMNGYRSDLSIKRAELRKLQTADNADMNKINAKIDEIGKMKTEMSKIMAAHLQKVRALLTDEQRVFFDSRHNRRKGPGMRMGRQEFFGNRDGSGPYCPRGISK
ncbi:MAG: Spy/CpxP family protein refolding chaperone [Bacteroidales bacterium]|nr:Spy/CpxP family protein refolding chaperone [Bacteroidales bacterium]